MNRNAALLSIVAYARSGAIGQAWKLFDEHGFGEVRDDPAVLSVLGRLLKDQAFDAQGDDRRRLLQKAADAYLQAANLGKTAYPLINAATLALLAGQPEQARQRATEVLAIGPHADAVETPYYRAATRAEALLLLGRIKEAESALADAIRLAPRAYEDHASTLRQFQRILDALHADAAWLARYRPPKTMSFAGHMNLAGDGAELQSRIASVIRENNVGWGFGALAAGADILVAECLLDAGAELHLVLPADRGVFRESSVAKFGVQWVPRFDRLLAEAASVYFPHESDGPISTLGIRWAAEIAMGSAIMKARELLTDAIQLLVCDQETGTTGLGEITNWKRELWSKSGREQIMLVAPRAGTPPVQFDLTAPPSACLAAMLHIEGPGFTSTEQFSHFLSTAAGELQHGQPILAPPRSYGSFIFAAFASPADAATYARQLLTTLGADTPLRIAGHYAIAHRIADPFFPHAQLLAGPATAVPQRVSMSTPPGAIHLTEDFAAALHACAGQSEHCTEFVGEMPSPTGTPVRLFSLRR